MGSFEEDKDIIKQNLECVTERPDAVFGIRMLMEDKCEMPDRETVQDVMDRHLGRSECFCYDAQVIGFSASQYSVHFAKENKDISPQLLIMGCKPITAPVMDGMEKSQTWDCPECDDILQQCTWQVAASDMMAAGLNYKERAEMLVQYVEALMELFPSCRAVVFDSSKKMFTRETLIRCRLSMESRFIYYAVNVRLFNIQGAEDMIVDSVGMSMLSLPDVQYHFHGVNPNAVVAHAYQILAYIFASGNPIKSGDSIDGFRGGHMDPSVQWRVQYENAMLPPARKLLDVNMGVYAAGVRE